MVTFFSVRVSDKPADADHQYGHGKFENFSAFIETGLLLLTCVWIVYEAIKRLFFHTWKLSRAWLRSWSWLSIAVDAWRSRALGRIATKYDSQALEADALHFSTDIWSSAVVIVGLALVWMGPTLSGGWLRQADPIAALFVAGVVISVSWRLARRTVDALLDAAPAGVRSQILDRIGPSMACSKWSASASAKPATAISRTFRWALERNFTFQRSEQVSDAVRRECARFCPMPT
jgi:cation diffusion facilitator family transporter